MPPASLPRSLAYARTLGPSSAGALNPALPDAPLVVAPACPDCGRTRPHTAFVDLRVARTDLWPLFFCTSPHKAPPICTRDTASGCVVGFHGMLLHAAVPVSAVPWATPCAPPPDPLLQPTPTFVLSLPDPRDQATTPLRYTSLTFLTHNLGGISGQVTLARTWLEALCLDIVAEQELLDTAAARTTVPLRYEAHYGSASGQGPGPPHGVAPVPLRPLTPRRPRLRQPTLDSLRGSALTRGPRLPVQRSPPPTPLLHRVVVRGQAHEPPTGPHAPRPVRPPRRPQWHRHPGHPP